MRALHLLVVLAALCAAAPSAVAAPCSATDSDPALPPCAPPPASHALDVTLVGGASAAAGAGTGAVATTAARADATYTIGSPAYALQLAGGVTASRSDGTTIDAFGGATRLAIALGPALPSGTVPAADHRDASGWVFPLTFELAHDGELAALPDLAHPADIARGLYSSEHVEAQTRAARLVDSDTLAYDFLPVSGVVDATLQDGTRLAETWSVAMMGLANRYVRCGLLEVDDHTVHLPSGASSHWFVAWPIVIDVRSPTTGTMYRLAWGTTSDSLWPGHHTDLYALGIADNRWGAGYERRPYITMTGLPLLEDRVYGEAVISRHLHLVARAFAARTERAVEGSSTTRVDWTGGVEGDGSRRVGAVEIAVRAEVGRSFYASLDDGVPTASFGARAAVTVSRATTRHYTR